MYGFEFALKHQTRVLEIPRSIGKGSKSAREPCHCKGHGGQSDICCLHYEGTAFVIQPGDTTGHDGITLCLPSLS